MEKRTEQEWRALFDAAVTSIIGGRCANSETFRLTPSWMRQSEVQTAY